MEVAGSAKEVNDEAQRSFYRKKGISTGTLRKTHARFACCLHAHPFFLVNRMLGIVIR